MILGLIRNLQLSIKNTVKQKAGASGTIFPVAFMFILMTVLLVVYIFRMSILEYNYDYINNSLTQSLLGGCVVNLEAYAKGDGLLIQEKETPAAGDVYVLNSYELFKSCLKHNLKLDDGWNILTGHDITGTVNVEEYRIYNVQNIEAGVQVTEYVIAEGNSYFIEHPAGEAVFATTADGIIEITETSVYGKISFTLHLMGYTSLLGEGITEDMMSGSYELSRVVAIKGK